MNQVLEQWDFFSTVSTKITYWISAGIVTVSTLTLQDWGILAGIILGTLTFIINTYFKWRLVKIEERRNKRRDNTD